MVTSAILACGSQLATLRRVLEHGGRACMERPNFLDPSAHTPMMQQ
jgi:hypothetical protein